MAETDIHHVTRISTSTTTTIGAGGEVRLGTIVVVNAGTSWTVTFQDSAGTALSGAMTVPAAGTTMHYYASFGNGLKIVTAGTAGEILVMWH